MPSHPDRVRRSYHEIRVKENTELTTGDNIIQIKITKLELATAMTGTEIYHNVLRAIKNGIFMRWKD